jgi:outer membrane protein OmpA-like peptidoglycan-associated protein
MVLLLCWLLLADVSPPPDAGTPDGAPTSKQVVICYDCGHGISIISQPHFQAGSTKIEPDAKPILEEVAKTLKDNPQVELVGIEGHTSGEERDPEKLGQKRAEAVRNELIRLGIDPSRLEAHSWGNIHPIVPNRVVKSRSKNRRVELLIYRANGVEQRHWEEPKP